MRKLVLLIGILGIVVFTACTKKEGASQSGASGEAVLHFSENGAPNTLDPTQIADIYGSMITRVLYDTPYEYKYLKRPYEITPNLAEDLPTVSKDGLVYTFKLKKGQHFIDDPCFKDGKGREVTAADFVYSIKRHFDPESRSKAAWLYRGYIKGMDAWKDAGADYNKEVEGIKALDSHTVQITLEKPRPQLIYTLAMTPASIVPKEAVDKYGREFSVHPVGSGPYKLESFNSKQVVMVRNPGYRERKIDLAYEGYDEAIHGKYNIKKIDGMKVPILDKITIDFMMEQIPRWNSFTKGSEIQYATVPIELVDEVLESRNPVKLKKEFADKYFSKSEIEFGFVYTNFNMDDERVGYNKDKAREARNKALRCAISKGFNWPERIERFYYGIGEAYPGVIAPGIDGYDPNLSRESVTYDPEGAKKLLKDNGWTEANLPDIEYGGVSGVTTKQFFEQFRGWMRKIGYPLDKIKFKPYSTFGDYSKAMKERKVQFHGLGWAIDYPDSENILQLWYGPNEAPGSNTANFKNPEYDKLYEMASVMQPGPERTKLYQKMNKILVDECVVIAGFSRTGIFVWHNNVIMYPDRDVIGGYLLKYFALDSQVNGQKASQTTDQTTGK